MTRNNGWTTLLKRFRDDTTGAVTLEFVLVMPFLFWAFMATYVFFDGYRQSSLNLKAANTIGDVLSRETNGVNDAYIDSMHEMLKLMVRAETELTLRVSVLRWDADDERYYVDWSTVRNRETALDDDMVQDIAHRLPAMPDGDRVILVETSNRFVPLLNVGLGEQQLTNFVYTRPRFAPRVAWIS